MTLLEWLRHRDDKECPGDWLADATHWPPSFIECSWCAVQYPWSESQGWLAAAENNMGDLITLLANEA